MKKTLLSLALYFIIIGIVCSQESEKKIAKIDSLLNNYIETGVIPHANIILVQNNNPILEKSYGYKDITSNEGLNLDHIFRLSSLSKLITSIAVMQLVDQGKINLNDPVENYIAGFKNTEILDSINPETLDYISHPANNKLTIHHLLSNTSGIAYGAAMNPNIGILYNKNGIDMGYDTSNISLEEKMLKLAKIPILHEAGEAWTYGFNYDVLGYIVEKASGIKYDEYLQKELFEPLGMNNTAFYLNSDLKDNLTSIHLYDTDSKTFYSTTETPQLPYRMPFNYPIEGSKRYLSGGVGINSSILDFSKILEMLYNNGTYKEKQILSSEAVQRISSGQIGELPFMIPNASWGYGNIVEKDNTIYWSEGGGFNYFKVNKEKEYILILFTQTMFSPYSTMKIFFQLDGLLQ